MPMYKKPLLVLLFIAALTSLSIVYSYFAADESSENAEIDLPDASSYAAEESAAKAPAQITVYVSGEVNAPGVVTLAKDSRAADAVKACGDFTAAADRNNINLAQKLEDGMQIKVPAAAGAPQTENHSSESSGKVNINTADESELDALPGVGPATAKKIIDYRNANGSFQSIEDIKNVKGIGDAKFEKMQDKISV